MGTGREWGGMSLSSGKHEGKPGAWVLRSGLLAVAIVIYAAYDLFYSEPYISSLLLSVLLIGALLALVVILLWITGSIYYAKATKTPRRILEQRVIWIRGDWRSILGGSLLIGSLSAGLAAAFAI